MSTLSFGPLDIVPEHLTRVSAESAVNIVRQLLVAEAQQIGIPITAVNVPSSINVADGGVDAEVSLVDRARLPLGLLREGHVRYQIKSGSFSAANKSELKSLVFLPNRAASAENLNHRVKACLDAGGTFVVLLFGAEATGTSDGYGVTELKEILAEVGYADANVEIVRANQLCSAITTLTPALALQINGIVSPDGAPLYRLEHLAESFDLRVGSFKDSESRSVHIGAISDLANTLNVFKHIRIIGDPGAGKTHLVYASLKETLSKDLVLYTDSPEKMLETPLVGRLAQASKAARIILVADDCDLQTAMNLEQRFINIAPHFLLITIFSQVGKDQVLEADLLDLESLEHDAMKAIFSDYGIPEDGQNWLSGLCQGSPRAAHIIGRLISRNPDIDYAEHFPALEEVWEAYVTSPHKRGSTEGINKLTVARCIALFKRIIWGTNSDQGRAAIDKAISLVSALDAATVSETIAALQKGRILQGNGALFITPKLLHIKLWSEWWDLFEHRVNDDWLENAFDGRMEEWFNEMFEYARESRAASRVVAKMLAPEGRFAELKYFTESGKAQLFFALAQAEPKAALRRLKDALGKATQAELVAFKEGRRAVIHGLERMAISESDFLDAVECLQMLAETENESWSNNATGVFESMFTLGYGQLAASAFAPIDKLPYLRQLLSSDIAVRRQLAIRSLRESLQAFMSRNHVGDTAGVRQLPDRWMPKSWDELAEAYLGHIDLLADFIPLLAGDEQNDAAMGIIGNTRSLIGNPFIAPRVIELLQTFGAMPDLKDKVTEAVEAALHYDKKGLKAEVVEQLESLQHELTERSFHDKLIRYAALQLTEDHFDDGGNYREGPHPSLYDLRDEILREPSLLKPELEWLLTEKAKNGFAFGSLLANADERLFWPEIRSSWLALDAKARHDFFIGGYLSGVFERDRDFWQEEILRLLALPGHSDEGMVLVWRSGMTDAVAEALVNECREGKLPARRFALLIYGARIRELPLHLFREVISRLIASDDVIDAEAALNLIQSWHRSEDDGPDETLDLLEGIVNHDAFVAGAPSLDHHDMREYHWTKSAEYLLIKKPEAALQLGIRCIENFGAEGSVTDNFYSETLNFFDALLVRYPAEVWGAISKNLESDISGPHYRLMRWLRGRGAEGTLEKKSGLDLLDSNYVLAWIKGDPKKRAPLIAHYCPPIISSADQPSSLARLVLEQFGDVERVNGSVHSNFMTAFFSGPASEYYQRRLDSVNALLSKEHNKNVRWWLTKEAEYLANTVQDEKAREESEDF